MAALIWGVTIPGLFNSVLASRFGVDFAHYYTLGWLAVHRSGEVLYDAAALHTVQATLVPALSSLEYPTVYPPQFAVLLAPFAVLPYGVASRIWIGISTLLYLMIVRRAAAHLEWSTSDRVLIWAAALAFPPFWYLVLFRQNSVIVLAIFFIASHLLERKKTILAGFALGFLAIKPQFGLTFAVLALYGRDLSLILGAVASVLFQALIVATVFGADVLGKFFLNLPGVIASANAIEPLHKSLSLRTLSRLLPSPAGEVTWVLACVLVLFALVRGCHARVPVRQYMALAILGAVLVNPHVYVYDGVVLVLPFIWLGEWRAARHEARRLVYQAIGFCAAALLMMPITLAMGPTAAVISGGAAITLLVVIYFTSARDLSSQYAVESSCLVNGACASVTAPLRSSVYFIRR